ncbi:hypothetical protein PanWU01x14_221000 [Parasponia andersonii]|uniref:DUF1985 domain-containing protein n=1 Tax=Parasponia andersonii TaxID=3476 RepID=A0A2P5BPJ3_PARAD|nr:hypothetical protein PanWU01x14_221000 [Parasponia andersonii]
MSGSRRLVEKYMNNSKFVRSGESEPAFLNCSNTEEAWKLGLYYLVDSLLLAGESTKKTDLDILSYVENEDEFFQFLWGHESFDKTMVGLKKDIDHYRKQYLKLVAEKKKPAEYKYIVYGFSIALQYWAYETVSILGTDYVITLV